MYSTENARQVKLALYKAIIDFYHQETNDRMFEKRWEELHDPKLADIGLEKRLESGIKGKDSANAYVPLFSISHNESNHFDMFVKRKPWMLAWWKEDVMDVDGVLNCDGRTMRRIEELTNRKYKDNNWFGAMYTYAIAWGCLIPYHPDDMTDDDPKKKQIASLWVLYIPQSILPISQYNTWV
jgi:hypothetical protein